MTNAYDKIDRFLRNNIDDPEYEEYSAALEEVLAAAPQQTQSFAESLTHRPWQQTAEPVRHNDDEVICPSCCHQFRAIPVNVQQQSAQIEQIKRMMDKYGECILAGHSHNPCDKVRDEIYAALDALKGE